MGDDLSSYERLRLENIKRNNAFFASLGLDDIKPQLKRSKVDTETRAIVEIKAKASKERKQQRAVEIPTRRSSRIAGVKIELEQEIEVTASTSDDEEDGREESIDYTAMPVEPEHLDDHEFQVLVNLRKWRLLRCRELQTEAYKIFQTRTLCEATRRRRNDPSFGSDDIIAWTEIWGIGPGKIRSKPETHMPVETLVIAPVLLLFLVLSLTACEKEQPEERTWGRGREACATFIPAAREPPNGRVRNPCRPRKSRQVIGCFCRVAFCSTKRTPKSSG